jgi:hypothetical protein
LVTGDGDGSGCCCKDGPYDDGGSGVSGGTQVEVSHRMGVESCLESSLIQVRCLLRIPKRPIKKKEGIVISFAQEFGCVYELRL